MHRLITSMNNIQLAIMNIEQTKFTLGQRKFQFQLNLITRWRIYYLQEKHSFWSKRSEHRTGTTMRTKMIWYEIFFIVCLFSLCVEIMATCWNDLHCFLRSPLLVLPCCIVSPWHDFLDKICQLHICITEIVHCCYIYWIHCSKNIHVHVKSEQNQFLRL